MNAPRSTVTAALLVALSLLIYGVAASGPFLHEDVFLIAENPLVHGFSHSARWFVQSAVETSPDPLAAVEHPAYWRPLVLMSWAFDWVLGPGRSLPFHLTSLFFHAVIAVLGYLTLRRWVGDGWPPVFASILFVIHPAKADAVAWAGGRADLLCLLGVLMTLRGVSLRLSGKVNGAVIELVGAALAYGSEESALVLPVLVGVETWVYSGRPVPHRLARKPVLLALVPHALLAVVYWVARQFWLPLASPELGAATRVGLVLELVGRSIRHALWPLNLTMAAAEIPVRDGMPVLSEGTLALGALGLGFLLVGIVLTWRTLPAVAVGLLGFGLTTILLATLGWDPHDSTLPPRVVSIPSLGLCLVVAEVLRRWTRPRGLAVGLVCLVLVGLGTRAWTRAHAYASEERFWQEEPEGVGVDAHRVVHQARKALLARRPRAALELCTRGFADLVAARSHEREAARLVLMAIEASEGLIPDRDAARLRALATFVGALRQGEAATALLPSGHTLELEPSMPVSAVLRREGGRLQLTEARIASRLGDDGPALEAISALLTRCPACSRYQEAGVWIAARAGKMDQASQYFERLRAGAPDEGVLKLRESLVLADKERRAASQAPPRAKPRFEARYLALLQAWGRAFTVLQPALRRGLDREAGEFAAELAFRAGEREQALALLQRHRPDADVPALLARWELEMQWVDAPLLDD